jgi:hypothetical protein
MEALKTAIHILNKVPSKSVLKTPYELWTGRKPSVNHLRVWGSPAEAKVFNLNIGKLDPRTVSCHFIGYQKSRKVIVSTVLVDIPSLWKQDTLVS